MNLLSSYQAALNKLVRDHQEQGKVIVYKGFQPELFAGNSFDIYLSPLDASGYLDPEAIELNKRAIYKELISPSAGHFILFEQLAYAIETSSFEPIKDNIIIVEDNLRALYPYSVRSTPTTDSEVDDEQILNAPLNSYAQVVSVEGSIYVKYVSLPEQVQSTPLFTASTALTEAKQKEHPRFVEIESDSTSIDLILNQLIKTGERPQLCVELSPRNPLFPRLSATLCLINACFRASGGAVQFYIGDQVAAVSGPNEKLTALLKQYWGPDAQFRPITLYAEPESSKRITSIGQDAIVAHILNQCANAANKKDYRDIFITAPTGAGKSLLFQLPAFQLSGQSQITLVISPLIALMKDQVQAIVRDRGFRKVAYLNSELSLVDRERVIEQVKAGEIDMVYLSPELLLSYDVSHFIGERKLGLVIIDEAHLVTTWGRDFRVDYWFLGNHLRKIRKYSGHDFVIVACTATAVYGGANDMVFDCMDSLYLKSPIYFIGSVKRNDIHFINGREPSPDKGLDSFKIKQTAKFSQAVLAKTEFKTLVYAPYVKQIRQVHESLEDREKGMTSLYYGSLDAISKGHYFDEFLSGSRRLMLATKAFGMGIDIKDIQVVYHHAPSGQLADYIQEIGRIARDPDIEGYAVINFSARDVRYMNVLHGISSVKPWELRGVLDKLAKVYQREKSKNLLFSVDDFANIFPDALDMGQKVMTALMMIERDYVIKSRFNVIIARPKKLFTRVFARVDREHADAFLREYGFAATELHYQSGGGSAAYRYVEIDLDHLWKRRFREQSFPMVKSKFFRRELFGVNSSSVVPQLKFTFKLTGDLNWATDQFKIFLEKVVRFFSQQKGFFKEEELTKHLSANGIEGRRAKSIAQRLLAMYGSAKATPAQLKDADAFLHRRHSAEPGAAEYSVFGNRYASEFLSILKLFQKVFADVREEYVRYAGRESGSDDRLMRLGYLLEMAEVGLVEIVGGEAPMVFVRLNDPRKVIYDSRNPNYSNILLEDVHRRHHVSVDIFKHFFLREMSDEERWNFVEDYFLGKEVDELLEHYPGEDPQLAINIIDQLPRIETQTTSTGPRERSGQTPISFPPLAGRKYSAKDLITLSVGGEVVTRSIGQWIKVDPVVLARARDAHKFQLDHDSYRVLESIAGQNEEYRKKRDGFEYPIKLGTSEVLKPAKSHFLDDPLKFYKWYCAHPDDLILSLKDKIGLFQTVHNKDKSALLSKHMSMLNPNK
ncbi:MAG: ATP-dependent DNA helicase RecQ [Flavobacteriales bacterium]|nr:ATP-dependent DNA helicase RecQ [Flavobacteriales bacterium]